MPNKPKRSAEKQAQINSFVPTDEFMTSNIRRACRVGFEVSTPYIVSIATGEKPDTSPFASISAHNELGKWSMGKQPKNLYLGNSDWLQVICELVAKHFGDNAKYEDWMNEVIATLEQMQ